MQCPSCGSEVPDGARFCPGCGHEVAHRADERRLVTVLFADIVGFTALSEARDPEQVKNLVDRCFALLADDITAFGGRVDKVVGDAIIALFGAPIAHEDDAERAVRAALRMQETVERFDAESMVGIQVRIGVNTGEVLVGGLTAGDDYTAMGDVVNTASRLQTAAEPGTVLVGSATHDATDEVIHYHSMGRLHARGREETVATWRALEPVGRPGERRRSPDTPLIGREPELGVLRRAVGAAYRRSRAQLITIAGESGLGKGRLATEVTELARHDHDALVLEGRCLPYGEANIWWPIAEAIRGAVGIDADADDGDARSAITERVKKATPPDADADEVERTTEGLLHLLGHTSRLSAHDAERATAEGTRGALSFLHGLAMQAPLLLMLRDLHWGDDAVLRLLDDLLDRLGRRQVVVMVTGRPAIVDRWRPHPRRFNFVSIALDPLDDAAADLIVRELLPTIEEQARTDLVRRAGGNPLFLHEMARMLADRDGADPGVLPANIRSVISARLDALEDPPRQMIEDAAVLGLRGPVEALHRMAEFIGSDIDVDVAIEDLDRADLLDVMGGSWSFRSNLVREVAYGRLTKTDRAQRHAGIASWIEARSNGKGAETIAFHYRRAATLSREMGGIEGLSIDIADRAVDWTVRAARESSGTTAIERSERLFGDALALMDPDDPGRADVLLERASAAAKSLRMGPARRDLVEAAPLVEASGDPRHVVRSALIESELHRWSNDQVAALAAVEEALTVAESLDDPVLLADGLRQRGMVELFTDRHEDAEKSITSALEAYERAADADGMAWARQNLAWISFVSGRMAEAEQRLSDSIVAFESLGDRAGIMWSRGLLAYVRIHAGRFAEAEELARRTLEESRERGDKWGQGMMSVALATAALWTGRVDEAIQRAAQARSLFPADSDPVGALQGIAIEGRALVLAGRVSEGMRVLIDALEANTPGDSAHESLRTSLASAAASVGDLAVARRVIEELVALDPDKLGESDRAVSAALAHLQMGNPDRAMRLAELMPAPGEGSASTWGFAVLALAMVSVGRDISTTVAEVESSTRATYADRVLARCALACGAVRDNDEAAARSALERAADAIPPGGDRLNPAIVAIATARCLAALGTLDADAAGARAGKAAAALGIDPRGWDTVFSVACGQVAAAATP